MVRPARILILVGLVVSTPLVCEAVGSARAGWRGAAQARADIAAGRPWIAHMGRYDDRTTWQGWVDPATGLPKHGL